MPALVAASDNAGLNLALLRWWPQEMARRNPRVILSFPVGLASWRGHSCIIRRRTARPKKIGDRATRIDRSPPGTRQSNHPEKSVSIDDDQVNS
jgi:hypothetical protein